MTKADRDVRLDAPPEQWRALLAAWPAGAPASLRRVIEQKGTVHTAPASSWEALLSVWPWAEETHTPEGIALFNLANRILDAVH